MGQILTQTSFRSRRDGRSANGTLTLRRSSTTPLSQNPQNPPATDSALQSPSIEPQNAQPATYELSPARYTKDELLSMAQPPRSGADVSRLFNPGWNSGQANGGGSRAWGKSNENHIPQEPGACWNETGDSTPLSLQPMSLEEREVGDSSVVCTPMMLIFGRPSRTISTLQLSRLR